MAPKWKRGRAGKRRRIICDGSKRQEKGCEVGFIWLSNNHHDKAKGKRECLQISKAAVWWTCCGPTAAYLTIVNTKPRWP